VQLFIRFAFSALILAASCYAAGAAENVKKLPGTAGTFAGVPWGSSPETIEALLAQRGYDYVSTDDDGDLVFSEKNPPAASVFEVLGTSQRLVKTLVVIKPPATSLTNFFDSASAVLVKKYGKPSEAIDEFSGQYKDASSDSDRRAAIAAGDGALATFWLYADGSSVYVQIVKDLSLQVAYESPRFKAAAAQPAATSANAVFVGPAGWHHVGGSADGLGSWLRPGDTGYSQNITVEAKDGFASLDALASAERSYVSGLPDVVGPEPTDVTVCGNHPAKYFTFTFTSTTGLPVTSEMVIAVFGTTAYSARYNKSISQDPDSDAEQSLSTLCGRAASH
jgi:hypothetical protein